MKKYFFSIAVSIFILTSNIIVAALASEFYDTFSGTNFQHYDSDKWEIIPTAPPLSESNFYITNNQCYFYPGISTSDSWSRTDWVPQVEGGRISIHPWEMGGVRFQIDYVDSKWFQDGNWGLCELMRWYIYDIPTLGDLWDVPASGLILGLQLNNDESLTLSLGVATNQPDSEAGGNLVLNNQLTGEPCTIFLDITSNEIVLTCSGESPKELYRGSNILDFATTETLYPHLYYNNFDYENEGGSFTFDNIFIAPYREAIVGGKIEISPTNLHFLLPPNDAQSLTLSITNSGWGNVNASCYSDNSRISFNPQSESIFFKDGAANISVVFQSMFLSETNFTDTIIVSNSVGAPIIISADIKVVPEPFGFIIFIFIFLPLFFKSKIGN